MRAVLDTGGEDPLDNAEQLADQMDALPFLCRFQYERTSSYLAGLMDPVLAAYSAAASAPGTLVSPDMPVPVSGSGQTSKCAMSGRL